MKPIIIFGNKEVAEAASFYFQNDSKRTVAGFTVDGAYCNAETFCDLPLVPFETIEKSYPPESYDMFIALGYQQVNHHRRAKFIECQDKGYDFASYISSRAIVWSKKIGKNCFIHDNNVIQPFSQIGDNVVMWTANVIGHHTIIEDHCFIAGHAAIAGKTKVQECSFIGANATIRDGISIGKRNVIGAGGIILKSTKDDEVYASAQTPLYPYKIRKI